MSQVASQMAPEPPETETGVVSEIHAHYPSFQDDVRPCCFGLFRRDTPLFQTVSQRFNARRLPLLQPVSETRTETPETGVASEIHAHHDSFRNDVWRCCLGLVSQRFDARRLSLLQPGSETRTETPETGVASEIHAHHDSFRNDVWRCCLALSRTCLATFRCPLSPPLTNPSAKHELKRLKQGSFQKLTLKAIPFDQCVSEH